jgi:hypothetical protein
VRSSPSVGVAPMAKTAAAVPEEQHFILSTLSPSPAQRRLALGVLVALLVAFVITAGPLSSVQPGRIGAFVPAYATAIFVIDCSRLCCCSPSSQSCGRAPSLR